MKKLLFTIFILFISISVSSQTSEIEVETIEVETNLKEFEGDNYTINYLSVWSPKTPRSTYNEYNEFYLQRNANSSNLDNVRESVSLDIYPQSSSVTLHSYVKNYIKNIKKQYKSVRVLSNDAYTIKGSGFVEKDQFNSYFHELVFTASYNNNKIKYKVKFLKRDNHKYILTYRSSEEEYNKYLKSANFILESISFK